jgi:hypothetical protein
MENVGNEEVQIQRRTIIEYFKQADTVIQVVSIYRASVITWYDWCLL